jgi:hypothetical protein
LKTSLASHPQFCLIMRVFVDVFHMMCLYHRILPAGINIYCTKWDCWHELPSLRSFLQAFLPQSSIYPKVSIFEVAFPMWSYYGEEVLDQNFSSVLDNVLVPCACLISFQVCLGADPKKSVFVCCYPISWLPAGSLCSWMKSNCERRFLVLRVAISRAADAPCLFSPWKSRVPVSFSVDFFSFATALICYRESRQSQGICEKAIHPNPRQKRRRREIGKHALVFPPCIYYTYWL